MIRVVAATPTSAWISRLSRSSRNDWSTLRPNHERMLKSWAVLAKPFLNRSSKPEIAISVVRPMQKTNVEILAQGSALDLRSRRHTRLILPGCSNHP